MKKLVVLILLVAGSVLAQERPVKEICLEAKEGCISIDSAEVVELKIVFNSLLNGLNFWLDLQRDFNDEIKVNQRFNDFDVKISALQKAKDSVNNRRVKNLLQIKIDATTKLRDELHSTALSSKRVLASEAESAISRLNIQLDDIESAINSLVR